MKKYICIGGNISSKTDNDIHYISPQRLAELYQVNPDECYFAKDDNDNILLALRVEELIGLRPRYHGDYKTFSAGEKRKERTNQ